MHQSTSISLKTTKLIFPETNIAHENGWLKDDRFLWDGFLAGANCRVHVRFKQHDEHSAFLFSLFSQPFWDAPRWWIKIRDRPPVCCGCVFSKEKNFWTSSQFQTSALPEPKLMHLWWHDFYIYQTYNLYPIGSMYGLVDLYGFHVGKYTSPMDGVWVWSWSFRWLCEEFPIALTVTFELSLWAQVQLIWAKLWKLTIPKHQYLKYTPED